MRRISKGGDFLEFTLRIKGFIALMVVMLLGVLIGSYLCASLGESGARTLSFITQGFLRSRTEQTLLQTLSASFFSSGLLVIISFATGFSAIGQPFTVFIPFFRGLGLGFSMSHLYWTTGFKGLLICLILILPSALISSLAIIIGTRESLKLSNFFLRYALGHSADDKDTGVVRLYLTKFTILLIICGVGALVDSVINFLFAGLLL
ncbi:MAG: hypothetical protein GX967_01550 [Clostridiales bacterium]|nr:hypothetical protein [Clostridiales bacterium]